MSTSRQITISYRSILPKDRNIVQKLHEEFFPVKYSASFYDNIIQEKGIHGGRLHSIMAVDENDEVIGFMLGQFLRYPDQCEDKNLFANPQPQSLYYILTLGVSTQYRRYGVASALVQQSIEYSKASPTCGGVFLHVIHYNDSAMRLYQKNQFHYYRTITNFYEIEGEYYTAYLYIYCLHGFGNTWWNRFFQQFGDWSEISTHYFWQMMHRLYPTDSTQHILHHNNQSSSSLSLPPLASCPPSSCPSSPMSMDIEDEMYSMPPPSSPTNNNNNNSSGNSRGDSRVSSNRRYRETSVGYDDDDDSSV